MKAIGCEFVPQVYNISQLVSHWFQDPLFQGNRWGSATMKSQESSRINKDPIRQHLLFRAILSAVCFDDDVSAMIDWKKILPHSLLSPSLYLSSSSRPFSVPPKRFAAFPWIFQDLSLRAPFRGNEQKIWDLQVSSNCVYTHAYKVIVHPKK